MTTITTNEGGIIIDNGTVFSEPKGSFSCVLKGDLVVIHSYHRPSYELSAVDTTVDGESVADARELLEALSSFSRGGGNGGGVTKEELDAAVEEAEGYRDVSEVNATNAGAAAQEAAASASDAGAYAENAAASSDLAGNYAQLAEESAQALNNSVLLENLALESKDILGFDPTKDQVLGHRRGVPQYIDL